MNVLLYTHFWAPSVGGVETITMSLAEGLARRPPAHGQPPIDVTLVTQTPAGGMDDSLLPFRVVRRPAFRDLVRLVRSTDLIHLAGPALLPLALGLLFRKPTVIEHHVYQAICPNGLLVHEPDRSICPGHFMAGRYAECIRCNSFDLGFTKSFRNLILAFPRYWLSRHAARNIAVSQHVAQRIGLPRTHTIYHGISDTGAHAASAPLQPGDPLQIGYVGRLVSEKGLPTLLEAVKQLEQENIRFHLTFIGNGPQRGQLERMTDSLLLRERVTFTGDLRGASFADALRSIQLVVMPSQWEETAGLAAIEHMMRGGVVIAADVGGLSEIVGDAGLKFATSDSAALADCFRRIHDNPSLAATLGAAAHMRALQVFNRDSMIESHASLYREVLRRTNAIETFNA